ncbi:GNAT family N-acetyltransferase [Luteimonas kalidii]|uniref:GNAT family N-acetyltransferase n=1 Tax=Luteimonas kalidii TaxID=3042025 RepID=A0ABT6JX61_9GAMM|nr:GNAT family N-acetyltransferase [Luteimonas kalidii]MDH5835282.1 GNAT family N-acetyltransferase [Luteimonas kalidii]
MNGIDVRWGPLQDLDAAALAEWSALGHEAPWASPFAMPEFVLPAVRWLDVAAPTVVRVLRAGRLLGVGCFVDEGPDLFAPLPRLGNFRSVHSFRCGMLWRQGEEATVADGLVRFARDTTLKRRHGLAFERLAMADPLARALARRAAHEGGAWHERSRFQRPVLRLDTGDVAERVPASLRKDLDRRLRRLRERGQVEFHLLHGADADAAAVDTHLRLEHQGWKREAGTSLLSCGRHASFFRELCTRFGARGAMVFSEIRLDGVPIASTSNMRLGDTLHAFKSGFDAAFARCSPGRLNEWMLMRALRTTWPQLRCFDSMSGGDGHMADLLPDREPVATGAFSLSRPARLALYAARAWRPLAWRFSGS